MGAVLKWSWTAGSTGMSGISGMLRRFSSLRHFGKQLLRLISTDAWCSMSRLVDSASTWQEQKKIKKDKQDHGKWKMRTLERSNLEWRGICTVYECRTQMIHGVDLIWLSQTAQTMILRYSTNLKNTVTPISLACLFFAHGWNCWCSASPSCIPRCQEGRFLEPEWSLAEAGLTVTWTCHDLSSASLMAPWDLTYFKAISWDITPYNYVVYECIWMYMIRY